MPAIATTALAYTSGSKNDVSVEHYLLATPQSWFL